MILRKLLATTSGALAAILLLTSVAFAEINSATCDSVNVRAAANTNASVLGQINANESVEVLETSDGWKKIKYGNSIGWVFGQFLKAKSGGTSTNANSNANVGATLTVIGDSVNLRSGPGTGYNVKITLDRGTVLTQLANNGKWTSVRSSSGIVGWVLSEFVSTKGLPANRTSSVSRGDDARNTDLRSRIVSYAKKFLGVRYVYGGTSSRGMDCSGFTTIVMDNFGVDMDRVAAEQAGQGSWVAKGDLRPGDLVFFDTDGGRNYINHVGIYMGDGSFIHASSGQGHVTVSGLYEGFYARTYMTGRRLVK